MTRVEFLALLKKEEELCQAYDNLGQGADQKVEIKLAREIYELRRKIFEEAGYDEIGDWQVNEQVLAAIRYVAEME